MKWNKKINFDECNIWFTSDLHLFHDNILRLNNRPFKDCDEMYEHIVNDWNSKVNENDYVFILGDVLWGSQASRLKNFAEKVNGHICIVLGNHDKEKDSGGVERGNFNCFYSVERAEFIKVESKQCGIDVSIYMSHYPALSWPSKSRGSWHLHGHVHGSMDDLNAQSQDLRVDVGFDGRLSQMKLISFADVYNHFLQKTNGKNFAKYMQDIYKEENTEIVK